MGKMIKKGTRGAVANYISRNKALKKLQVTLKDFRRLCIVKGIYPRDPKKKKDGKDKTYYHIKDIKFLAHEPLLMKFRDLKSFLKKYKKAQVKKDKMKMQRLNRNKPKLIMDHLVRERYPSFVDALRDLDDSLCMVHLFASLPAKITRSHSPEMAEMANRLCAEFQSYIFRMKCLKKTFVSIKGIYYQAEVMGQEITWLVPHKFCPVIPSDVDFRVMLTFLEFYLTMVKFVNFKLYHDEGLHYPPKIDDYALAQRAGLSMLKVEELKEQEAARETEGAEEQGSDARPQLDESLQEKVQDALENLAPAAEPETEAAEDENEDEGEDAEEKELLAMVDGAQEEAPIFDGLTFVLGREVPVDSVEFVLLCGGAKVLREDQLTDEQMRSHTVTHQIMDRPTLKHNILSREYIQPQWVYDSINALCLLPTEPYQPGTIPPPHLSPFVNDEEVGYVPAQRKVLAEWGAKSYGNSKLTPESLEKEENEDVDEDEGDEAEEADEKKYAAELELERSGVTFSEKQGDAEEEEEEEEVEGEGDESDEGDEGDEEEEEDVKVAPKKRTRADKEKELAMTMMSKKDARLYSKMQYGINKKKEAVDQLTAKRQKIEKTEAKAAKKKKSRK